MKNGSFFFNLELNQHLGYWQSITLLLTHVISCLLKRDQCVLVKINHRECDSSGRYKSIPGAKRTDTDVKHNVTEVLYAIRRCITSATCAGHITQVLILYKTDSKLGVSLRERTGDGGYRGCAGSSWYSAHRADRKLQTAISGNVT